LRLGLFVDSISTVTYAQVPTTVHDDGVATLHDTRYMWLGAICK